MPCNPADGCSRARLFLGVRPTESHASEIQFSSLDAYFERIVALYNDIFKKSAITDDIYRKLTGTMGDHAHDVSKTSRLWRERKASAVARKLASDRLASFTSEGRATIKASELEDAILQGGGKDQWAVLPVDRRASLLASAEERMSSTLADEQRLTLSQEERRRLQLFIHSGCGSHKLSNLFKHGTVTMHNAWPEGEGPALLFNKDNQAIMDDAGDGEDDPGYGDSQRRAVSMAQGGGVKLTALAGAVFNNSDTKKGQHEVHRTFIKTRTGSSSPFQTQTSRFCSHGKGASELVTRKAVYIEFLEIIKDAKDSMSWTNIEKNVYKGLHDPATVTELCAMSIFMESFYHPAFRTLRGREAGLRGNALEQGPFYDRITEFLGTVAQQPELILNDTTYQIATFDGEDWNRKEAVDAVRSAAPDLPQLRHCVVKMFEGARDACASFMSEFVEGGANYTATAEERELSFRPPTNDCSEGDLGSFRLFIRQRQTKNYLLYNANRQYHENKTTAWEDYRAREVPGFYTAVSKEARRRVDSRESEMLFERIVAATEARASTNRVDLQKRTEKEKEEVARLTKIPQQMGLEWPKTKGVTKDMLKDQLKKYRQLLDNPAFLGSISGNKETLIKQYLQAVESWQSKQAELGNDISHTAYISNSAT